MNKFAPQTTEHTLSNGAVVQITELSAKRFQDIYAPINEAKTDAGKAKLAQAIEFQLVAECVKSDGESITAEQAQGFSRKVVTELSQLVLRVNGLGNDAKEDAKND